MPEYEQEAEPGNGGADGGEGEPAGARKELDFDVAGVGWQVVDPAGGVGTVAEGFPVLAGDYLSVRERALR